MSINFVSPITGGAQTGFTSPTYTVVTDASAPNPRMKQVAVSALGGTQTGVRTHSISDPFTASYLPPAAPKALPSPNSLGKYPNIPMNVHTFIFRKGMNYAANQSPKIGMIRVSCEIPAGADNYDAANVRALASLAEGAIAAFAAGLGDTLVTGI